MRQQPRLAISRSSTRTETPTTTTTCPHQHSDHLQHQITRMSATTTATTTMPRSHHHHHNHHQKRNHHSSRSSRQATHSVIRASEYRNLRQVVPSLRRQRDLGKVEVVTEAARYIDHLHKTLIKRFVACGIPESLKDVLGTDNANELNSQHIMNLVSQMAAKQRATSAAAAGTQRTIHQQQTQQPIGAISTTTTTNPPILVTIQQQQQQRRSLPVPAGKRCAADEPAYFGSAHQ